MFHFRLHDGEFNLRLNYWMTEPEMILLEFFQRSVERWLTVHVTEVSVLNSKSLFWAEFSCRIFPQLSTNFNIPGMHRKFSIIGSSYPNHHWFPYEDVWLEHITYTHCWIDSKFLSKFGEKVYIYFSSHLLIIKQYSLANKSALALSTFWIMLIQKTNSL